MSTKKPIHDLQDPLPESNWVPRRILMFGFALLLTVAFFSTSILVAKLAFNEPSSSKEAIKGLVSLVIALAWLVGLLMVLYLIAPSGEQVAKMFAHIAALKHGGFSPGSFGSPGLGRPGYQDTYEEDFPPRSGLGGPGGEDLTRVMGGKE